MKSKLHLLVCITALCALPLMAGDAETKSVNAHQRLLETDFSLALQQYEHVKMAAFEADLQLALLGTEEDIPETARKKRAELLETRSKILQERAAVLRETVLQLGDQIAVDKAK
jgi:hypothetical protein